MSELTDLQEKFTVKIARLILWGDEQGYKMRLAEGYDDDGVGHKRGSNHYIRLAQDILIFKNPGDDVLGKQDLEAHRRMHDCWDSFGGAPRIENDLGHYSLVWRGGW